jgi:sugar lactone lactonase YvrE
MTAETTVLLDGLAFPEGPRWHNGKLWFSDMHSGRVLTVGLDGTSEVITQIEDQVSGLGWLSNGKLLMVSMKDRKLLRLDDGEPVIAADLSKLATYHCNDMVVDRKGRAYVGNFGYDLRSADPPKLAEIIIVTEAGDARVAAKDLAFPNGMVITPDERTLIVAETYRNTLSAFDIEPDGSLSRRRVWAEFEKGITPDGIALDAEGAIWVASPAGKFVVRVKEGGEILERIQVDYHTYACMLGGDDKRTLFICESGITGGDRLAEMLGRIETIRVDIPGAGLP